MKTGSKHKGAKSFKQKLGKEELAFFNEVAKKPFSGQAVAFLNAYWEEVSTQAPFIFNVAWEKFKKVDMDYKGIDYIHLYDEGRNLDFDAGLKFFEEMVKYCDDEKNDFVEENYETSYPKMMTSIVRKKELKSKVDVNFDGRVSFLEYLLYQYQDFAKPDDFVTRSQELGKENPYIREARLALEKAHEAIKAYEKKKAALEAEAKKKGVKGLKAKNQLAQLDSSPLMESLRKALITAEAALRKVKKKYKDLDGSVQTPGGTEMKAANGALYWMTEDSKRAKKKYQKKK